MDDPTLDPRAHARALAGLARLNRLSAAERVLLPPVLDLAKRLGRPPTVLDVATGSADVPLRLHRAARRAGVALRLIGADVSATALERARARADAARIELELHRADALSAPLPRADVVACSLFLHHLTDADAGRLLARMAETADHLVLASDLRRCAWGGALTRVVPRLVTRSRVVHTDAVLSARAAFTVPELRVIAADAGLDGVRVRPRFPARMLLEWHRAR
jgi:hypothetical protein